MQARKQDKGFKNYKLKREGMKGMIGGQEPVSEEIMKDTARWWIQDLKRLQGEVGGSSKNSVESMGATCMWVNWKVGGTIGVPSKKMAK